MVRELKARDREEASAMRSQDSPMDGDVSKLRLDKGAGPAAEPVRAHLGALAYAML